MKKQTLSRIERSRTQTVCRTLLWAALSLMITSQSAFSQNKPENELLENIMVTAQKRSESLQKTPFAMQTFYGIQLKKLEIQKASDITRITINENTSGQNAAHQQIMIRKVETLDIAAPVIGTVNYIANPSKLGGEANGYISVNPGMLGSIELATATIISLSNNSALRLAGKSYSRDGIWTT
ncbi:MAG: iron complex outermembrane receptor protein [Paraglaciecola sp.]|jgi:iron complex outermembrane receptor protein